MKKILILSFLFCLNNVNAMPLTKEDYILKDEIFNFRELTAAEMVNPITTWATNYYIPRFDDLSGDIPMRDLAGNELGPKLSLHDWCHSALEGSVKIFSSNGTSQVYNYIGTSELNPVDCGTILPFDLSKTKFKLSNSIFGEGVGNYNLVPYRTIATDHTKIPAGTVLYIPSARGSEIKVGDETIIHDGYFFVGDRGGAIKDNHIDVFTGISKSPSFFSWIGHKAEATFEAFIVTDPEIITALIKLHQK